MKLNFKGRREKGITLIALVITIIVLLILAGVSIATLTGNNGILKQANQAKENNNSAAAKEKVQVSLSNYKFLLLSNKVMIEDELMYIKNSEFKTNKMEIYFNGKSHCLAKSLIEFE